MKKKKIGSYLAPLNRSELENVTGGIPYKKPIVLAFDAPVDYVDCETGTPCTPGSFNGIACKTGYGCTTGTVTTWIY